MDTSGFKLSSFSGGGRKVSPFCSSVASHRRRQLGHKHSFVRVSSRVYGSSSGNGGHPSDSPTKFRPKKTGSTCRTSGFNREKGSLPSARGRVTSGFFRNLLFGAQKVGRMAPNHQSETSERIHKAKEISHGMLIDNSQVPVKQYMGNVDRSSRCVSPYSNSCLSSQMVKIQNSQSNLSIPLSSIRSINSTPCIHTRSHFRSCFSSPSRCKYPRLLRRLAYHGSQLSEGEGRYGIRHSNDRESGVYRQFNKISSTAHATSNVPWCRAGLGCRSGVSDSGEGGKTADGGTVTLPLSRGNGIRLASSVRPYGKSGGHSALVQTTHAATSTSSQQSLPSKRTRSESYYSGFGHCARGSSLVAQSSQPISGNGVSPSSSSSGFNHGRVFNRLGGM